MSRSISFFLAIVMQIMVSTALFSQHSRSLYYEIGDTLTVLAKSGLSLRDGQSVQSGVITKMPFGAKVIALARPGTWEEIDLRKGCWMQVKYENQTGYVFSGYLTRLKLPPFSADPSIRCFNLQWFDAIVRANTDSLICTWETLTKGFDPDGKDWSNSMWEFYQDGTILRNVFGYEQIFLVIETSTISMNDILNILEYYEAMLIPDCADRWERYKWTTLEIAITRGEYGIEKIESANLAFTAQLVGGRNVISLRYEGM